MSKSKIWLLKENFLWFYDPEKFFLIHTLRTAFLCFFIMVIFQLLGYKEASIWAGFSALAFVQNDIYGSKKKRVYHMIFIIIFFTLITTLGFLFSQNSTLLILSIPIIFFIIGYSAYFAQKYFQAGGWALFLYIAASASSTSTRNLLIFTFSFLCSGVLTLLLISLSINKNRFYEIDWSAKYFLTTIFFIFQKQKLYSHKISKLEKNLLTCMNNFERKLLDSKNIRNKDDLCNIFFLLEKIRFSILHWFKVYERIKEHQDYKYSNLEETIPLLKDYISSMIDSLKTEDMKSLNLEKYKEKIELLRGRITEIREKEIKNQCPDFYFLLNSSRCLYNVMQVIETLNKFIEELYNIRDKIEHE